MTTEITASRPETTTVQTLAARARATAPDWYMIVPRIIAGLPLFGIGMIHVLDAELRMRPLVDAAGLPLAAVLSPVAVAIEIIAGLALLAGFWARAGALLAIPTMLVALYAHFTIDVWPNGADNEPPLALPIVVIVCAAIVLWRGAGRWSLDGRASK